MGISRNLNKLFSFIYKVDFNNGLIENEFLHIFSGKFDGSPKQNPEEVMDYEWVSLEELRNEIGKNPEKYSYWMRRTLERFKTKEVDGVVGF